MTETEDTTQLIIELEKRINYLEKKFGVSQKSPEILFPKTVNVVEAEINTANGES